MLVRADAEALDAGDPLKEFRSRFEIPASTIYLDGNSLGALPRGTDDVLIDVVRAQWGCDLIRSWNAHDWIGLPLTVGAKIARLIGAAEDEVVVCDSTSTNLFKLLIAALRARPGRHKIVIDREDFPTDLYVAQGVADLLGEAFEVATVNARDLPAAIDEATAVVAITQVDFRTGELFDIQRLCTAAHAKGALFLCDLSHSAGALPLDLDALNVDLAVGCGYKYLNGGPGAPAFLYVAKQLQDSLQSPIWGWMGHAAPFEFSTEYIAASGIRSFTAGTPSILGLAALNHALDTSLMANMKTIREKSLALTSLFMELVEDACAPFDFEIATPRGQNRGSQVSLRHHAGYQIVQALISRGVIGDFRSPDMLRFGFAPLYLRYVDIWDAVDCLKEVMESGAWQKPEFQSRSMVT